MKELFWIVAVVGGIIGAIILGVNCYNKAYWSDYSDVPYHDVKLSAQPDRFTIELKQMVKDKIAYGDLRGVYVITDTKTGKEFIGVSGVGIAELGSHQADKTTVTDER